jgi:hypothetical protein
VEFSCLCRFYLKYFWSFIHSLIWFVFQTEHHTAWGRKRFLFIHFVSAPYFRREFLNLRTSQISPMFQRSCQLWNLLQEIGLQSFLSFNFYFDKFLYLTSEVKHMKLSICTMNGRLFLRKRLSNLPKVLDSIL